MSQWDTSKKKGVITIVIAKSNTVSPLLLNQSELLVGSLYLVFEQIFLPILISLINHLLGDKLNGTAVNLIFHLTNSAACAWIFRRILIRSIRHLKHQLYAVLKTAATACLLALVGMYLSNLIILSYTPVFSNANNDAVIQLLRLSPLTTALETILLAPITEECLFRGLLLIPLYRRRPAAGYLISALAFSAIHVMGFIGQAPHNLLLLSMLQYLPTGLALAWACVRTNNLICPILTHSLLNTLSFITIYVTSSF